jgi:hypothetical protein
MMPGDHQETQAAEKSGAHTKTQAMILFIHTYFCFDFDA